ncbi:hypothetical protein N431DRAFT_351599 [Stipitochalara longipes BDJ]|nr:hypothetical protein N431DRAFT_351599 [Stipitochalara longipes BDJ]
MSGVEIAGFVLGGFPLLISAAEHYREGFEPLVKWKRFRTEFIGFIDAVDIEKQLFDQMLERFLISADVPHEEIQLFMTDRAYAGWQREDLVRTLRLRLGASYDVYMSTIKTMDELMHELHDLLSLKNGEVVNWAEDATWDYQLKRIRLSFSKRGPKTVASLENHNRKLRELLDSNDKLDSMKATRKDTTLGTIFECIRGHASSVHTAIKKSWTCNCNRSHATGLRLQKRLTGDEPEFSMAFNIPEEVHKPPTNAREVTISIKKKPPEDSKAFQTSPAPSLGELPAKENYIGKLRTDFTQSTPQLSVVSRPPLHTSLSELPSPSLQTPLKDVSYNVGHNHSAPGNVSDSGMPQSLTNSISRGWRKVKPKKTVRMEVSMPTQIPISQPPSIQLQCFPAQAELRIDSPSADSEVEIKDLCLRLSAKEPCHSLGYICDEKQRQHMLRPAQLDELRVGDFSYISLASLLQGQSDLRLTRHERYKVASILASSLLQLQSTPWLAEKMEKNNIFFCKQDNKVFVDRPYIRHSFPSLKSCQPCLNSIAQPSLPPGFMARNSLSNLGILLLELCFGQPIENQTFRNIYLGPDGKPHNSTDYMTALYWADMVCEEDPALEHVVKCCVFCIFEEKADWNNKKFIQAVYVSVVEPLEKIIAKWAAVP